MTDEGLPCPYHPMDQEWLLEMQIIAVLPVFTTTIEILIHGYNLVTKLLGKPLMMEVVKFLYPPMDLF